MLDATLLSARTTALSGGATDKARALKVGREFEAVFLADAFKLMMQDVSPDPLSGNDSGLRSWRELLVDEYAKNMVERGGIGLADQIARELLAVQESNVR